MTQLSMPQTEITLTLANSTAWVTWSVGRLPSTLQTHLQFNILRDWDETRETWSGITFPLQGTFEQGLPAGLQLGVLLLTFVYNASFSR